MTVKIEYQEISMLIELEKFITPVRQVIWIGAKDEGVYNTLHIDGVDVFQSSISYDRESQTWTLSNGQVRTHCTRGLKSDRSRACSLCRGCCAYVRTANPDYSRRMPNKITLLNGNSLPDEGVILKDEDVISFR